MTAHRSTLSVAAAIGATFCWGSGMTLTKLALGQFEPSMLLLVQLLSSIVFLVVVLMATGLRRTSWSQLLRSSGLGVLEPGLAYLLGLEGLRRISAAEAVVLSTKIGASKSAPSRVRRRSMTGASRPQPG